LKFIACVFLLITSVLSTLHAQSLSLGLRYPGLALKVGLSDSLAVELCYLSNQNLSSTGFRGLLYPNPKSQLRTFIGGEYNLLNAKTDKSESAGNYMGGFIGAELFITPSLSFTADIGYGTISLTDTVTSVIQEESYPIVNAGINYYLVNSKTNKQKLNERKDK